MGIRKYKVNDNYFKVWSRNMAYILGFWFADGCIIKKQEQYKFNIGQNKKDKYLLKQMLGEMGSNYPLFSDKKHNYCSFTISSKTVYDDIITLGGQQRKSLTVEFPSVSKKYLSDFIRGLWDGDGSVFYSKYSKCYNSSYVSGSKKFIYRLHCVLKENISNLHGSIIKQKESNVYRLIFSNNDTIRLREFLYKNIGKKLRLVRKQDIFNRSGEILQYLDYDSAKKYISNFSFSNIEDWKAYCGSGNKPENIPYCPEYFYKGNGWNGYGDFLGNGNVATRNRLFFDFCKARTIVRDANLKDKRQYANWVRVNGLSKNIPFSPFRSYQNKGWHGWSDWLGL